MSFLKRRAQLYDISESKASEYLLYRIIVHCVHDSLKKSIYSIFLIARMQKLWMALVKAT